MRPRKRLLLVDQYEQRGRVREFVLENTGRWWVDRFRAVPPEIRAEWDGAIVDLGAAANRKAVAALQRANREIRILALGDGGELANLRLPRILNWAAGMAQLLDAARLLTCHKRGPKKMVRRAVGTPGMAKGAHPARMVDLAFARQRAGRLA